MPWPGASSGAEVAGGVGRAWRPRGSEAEARPDPGYRPAGGVSAIMNE